MKKTLIEMAREAGIHVYFEFELAFEHFVALIRSEEQKKWEEQTVIEINEALIEEREACAKLIEDFERNGGWVTKEEASAAIRARSKT